MSFFRNTRRRESLSEICNRLVFYLRSRKDLIKFRRIRREISRLEKSLSNGGLNDDKELLDMMFKYDTLVGSANGVREGNDPFLFSGNNLRKAVIVVHGFRDSPHHMKEFGEHLREEGFDIYGVRLNGHGTSPKQLRKSKCEEWFGSVEYAYRSLRHYSGNISVVGTSLGGDLGFILAEKFKDIKSVVSLGTPIYITSKVAPFARLIKYFKDYLRREIPEGEGDYSYKDLPLAAVAQLERGIAACKRGLSRVKQPTLILQSERDTVVEARSADFIYETIGSNVKYKKFYPVDEHILLMSRLKKEVFRDITDFLVNYG